MIGRIFLTFLLLLAAFPAPGCGPARDQGTVTLVMAGGSGAEEAFAQRQLAAFEQAHPGVRVVYQATPSSASERHTLFVTWLSSCSRDIDVLNLDVIWIPEFAAAGWLLPLDGRPETAALPLNDYLPAALASSRYRGRLYALPWFADAGLLYYRRDLYQAGGQPPPRTFRDLVAARDLQEKFRLPYGFLFQGQAYEGLVTVVLEWLWSNGGGIFDPDTPENREALAFLVDLIHRYQVAPLAVATFLEEDCRRAFEQGNALLMRNWPYAYALMNRPGSPVKGKFAVLPVVHGPRGSPVSCFGGGALGVSAYSRHPREALQLIRFLTRRDRLKARALALGMLPPLKSLYYDPELQAQFPYLKELAPVFLTARPRPISPLYSFIGDILRIHFSRALTRQETPAQALKRAEEEIARVLRRYRGAGGAP
ncbi:MAG: ABC transporter substrate-binding protein [Deltaproteobacteria bacterium]|nr:ABC transporter substrate-binding protein [Deltaproteobacteria bacterium]